MREGMFGGGWFGLLEDSYFLKELFQVRQLLFFSGYSIILLNILLSGILRPKLGGKGA